MSTIHETEILHLRDDAAHDGNTRRIDLCNAALTGDETAWAQCERIIIKLRGNAEFLPAVHPGAWNRLQYAAARRDELLAAVREDRENARYFAPGQAADRAQAEASQPASGIKDGYPPEYGPWSAEKTAADAWETYHELHGTSQPEPKAAPDPDPIRARWVCGVVRSGYHNGAGCFPGTPHDGWGCGWRYEISLTATPENEAWLRGHGFNPQPAEPRSTR